MRKITSESPDRKKQIIIDRSSETVTFIGCHIPSATSFFSIPRPQAEFVCRFEDILDVYTLHNFVRRNWILVGRPPKVFQIATASGNAMFSANWSNSDEARSVLSEISASTSDAPALRNLNIGVILLILGCSMAAAICVGLYFWLTGK